MKMVGYLSLGYPTLERSLEMADVYIEGGCNAVEISIPSPNPCYEKETIKTWMQEAYAAEAESRRDIRIGKYIPWYIRKFLIW